MDEQALGPTDVRIDLGLFQRAFFLRGRYGHWPKARKMMKG